MKNLIGLVVLCLSMVGCAVEPAPEIADDTSTFVTELSSSVDEAVAGSSPTAIGPATTQGCSGTFFSCEASCPFNGQRNVIVQICDGVEVVVRQFPCTPEGCF
jgi:hypothetical protein